MKSFDDFHFCDPEAQEEIARIESVSYKKGLVAGEYLAWSKMTDSAQSEEEKIIREFVLILRKIQRYVPRKSSDGRRLKRILEKYN